MTRNARIRQVFQMLRREVPDEVMSDRELLRASVRLVLMHERRRPRRSRRAGESVSAAERQWSTDFTAKRRGFRVLCDADAVFHEAYDVADRRHDSAYADYRALAES